MARTRKQVAQINVVPMIDVMLVLLVIFMVTAPFINPGQVDLPSVGKTAQPPAQPLEILIKESGEYRLRNRATGGAERVVRRRRWRTKSLRCIAPCRISRWSSRRTRMSAMRK